MSAANPPFPRDPYDEDPPESERTTPIWKTLAIWGGVAAFVVVCLVITTGRVAIMNHFSRPREQQISVPMASAEKPFDRGPTLPPQTPQPQRQEQHPVPHPQTSFNPIASQTDERQVALTAPITGYQISPAEANAIETAAVKHSGASAVAGGDDPPLPGGQGDALEASLRPSRLDGVRVSEAPNPTYTIEQGRVLQCNQQTAADTTVPGGIAAYVTNPIRGETGTVVLMPAGARLTGTITHSLTNGLDRTFVLWQKLRTPVLYNRRGLSKQFDLDLASPATDDLGNSGLDLWVDRHLLQKVGGILGLSFIQAGLQAGVNYVGRNQGQGNQTFNFNSIQGGGQSASDALLRSWIDIPDVGHRNQGERCGVYIIRDLPMEGAYKLVHNYTESY